MLKVEVLVEKIRSIYLTGYIHTEGLFTILDGSNLGRSQINLSSL